MITLDFGHTDKWDKLLSFVYNFCINTLSVEFKHLASPLMSGYKTVIWLRELLHCDWLTAG